MGDRSTPIKFGPEWLRNLARDTPANNPSQSSNDPGPSTSSGNRFSAPSTFRNVGNRLPLIQNSSFRVQLAKLRYGREEMLALYDKNLDPPGDLKSFELLYSPRGKPPIALSNNFDDDTRGENLRAASLTGAAVPADRFGSSRPGMPERSRTRAFPTFARQNLTSRHVGKNLSLTTPYHGERGDNENAYGENPTANNIRNWNTSNNPNTLNRNTGDSTEWSSSKPFKRWPGQPTSWRRHHSGREDDGEWRSDGRTRATDDNVRVPTRWTERERGDRPQKERPQSWSVNKRSLAPDSPEDPLPEWAVDNADNYQGTFDSSGAFHGYSSDDSNLPKTPADGHYALTRSQTHGNISRSKSVEEGSEEWWSSDKSKRNSTNKFDATEIKFRKPTSASTGDNTNVSGDTNRNKQTGENKVTQVMKNIPQKEVANEDQEKVASDLDKKVFKKSVSFDPNSFLSKRFDALMRPNIKDEEADDENGNFNSVMITPHNSLRQMHQNIVNAKEASTSHGTTLAGNEDTNEVDIKESSPGETVKKSSPSPIMSTTAPMQTHQTQITQITPVTNITSPGPNLHNIPMLRGDFDTASRPTKAEVLAERHRLQQLNNPMPPPNLGLRMPFAGNQSGNFAVPRFGGMSSMGLNDNRFPVYPPEMTRPPLEEQNSGRNLLYLVQGNTANGPVKTDIHSPVVSGQAPMFPAQGIRAPSSQSFKHSGFGAMAYESHTPPTTPPPQIANLDQQWYYEDPEHNIQGPFSSIDMANWHRAGYFDSNIMVRQASETIMRPLGSYGTIPPFMMAMAPPPRYDIMDSDTGFIRMPPFGEQVESLWGQQSTPSNMGWMRPAIDPRYAVYYWDSEPIMMPNSSLPETKDMKTEDQILAQIRATQTMNAPEAPTRNMVSHLVTQNLTTEPTPLSFLTRENKLHVNKTLEDPLVKLNNISVTPNLEELEKLIHKDSLTNATPGADIRMNNNQPTEILNASNTSNAKESIPSTSDSTVINNSSQTALQILMKNKNNQEPKQQKPVKAESHDQTNKDKNAKNKDNNGAKIKSKINKSKDEKEEDSAKSEKKLDENTPTKLKKEEKPSKKDTENDKKIWLCSGGFNIVKGPEKGATKKKTEEAKTWSEAEKKRKEPEVNEEDKIESNVKTPIVPEKVPAPAAPTVKSSIVDMSKKSPWNSEETTMNKPDDNEGLSLMQIQRMERLKKMEEQQQTLQLLAQQQQIAITKEQEMQAASVGWAKMKGSNGNLSGQSLAEIQAETRRQAAAAAAAVVAAVQAPEVAASPPQPTSQAPWKNAQNGVGFWDTELQNCKQPTNAKTSDKPKASKSSEPTKTKKKSTAPTAKQKKEVSPTQEFESWCNVTLVTWSTNIDVPTFVSFLKDIESPYEVKDYVKYYLGDTRDSSEFARQFLEKRSKLLRGSTTTPVDDLCSPALAINPKSGLNVEHQEVKGKGKKTKKNKMQKIDSRILGFSVTAAEDRINVGDIDTV